MLFLVFAAFVAFAQAKVSYEGYQVIQVKPRTTDEIQRVMKLVDDKVMRMSLWSEPRGVHPFDVMAPPETVDVFTEFLIINAIDYNVALTNVQRTIDDVEASRQQAAVTAEQDPTNYILSDYQRHSTINNWLNSMAAQYTLATVRSIGNSYEARSMRAITISSGAGRPAIVMDCGIHAREWISPSTCIYAIKTLLEQYGNDATVGAMIDNYDWHILPVANPDGYEYTHAVDRLWRKTRSPTNDVLCTGTDANRNFDIFWGEAGVDFDPCADTYPGSAAFSEIETQNIRDWINSIPNKKLYLNVHSFTQLWLTPWGYNPQERYPSDYAELERVAILAMDALQAVDGRSFIVGTPPDLLYGAAGGAFDWAKAVAGVPYSYAPELRPSTSAEGGFVIPASNIQPAGAEVFAALSVFAAQMQ